MPQGRQAPRGGRPGSSPSGGGRGRSSRPSSRSGPTSRPGAPARRGRPDRLDQRAGPGRPPARPAPQTEADRRAREVAARRGPRPERDPDLERRKIEERTLDEWIDEGAVDVRGEAAGAAVRAAGSPPRRRTPRPLDPDAAADISSSIGDRRRAERLQLRLAEAREALDHDRLDEARRLSRALLKELPGVPAVHEVAGLVAYRLGRWRDAVRELETSLAARHSVELMPVLADSYRALRRWTEVERLWGEIREISPNQEVIAEARMVAAGAQADQGDFAAALRTMDKAGVSPKKVRTHHLRQWYVLGDLHDRAGNPLEATRWFERIAATDPDFVDVRARLRALGR